MEIKEGLTPYPVKVEGCVSRQPLALGKRLRKR